jgi:hypothetical protein
VAVGTIAVAVMSYRAVEAANNTADEAGKQARASEQQAVASEKQAAALLRPIIVDVPIFRGRVRSYKVARSWLPVVEPGPSNGPVMIRLPIRNVGPGPAFVDMGGVTFTADVTEAKGEPERGVVAAGETSYMQMTPPGGHDSFYGFRSRITGQGSLTASVSYTDVALTPYAIFFELEWDESVSGYRVMRMKVVAGTTPSQTS